MSNIKTYTKGKSVKLSNNFTSKEFDCKGSGCCSSTKVDTKLVEYLQNIREHFGKAVTITSGYRCPTHNKSVNGATSSKHAKGEAADITVKGIAPREVAKYAESIGIKGIGLYETDADGYFVHIDTRTYKSFWYGQAQAYRTTFGGAVVTTSSSDTYTREEFIKDVQKIIGVTVNGKTNSATLNNTVTLSAWNNRKHALVKPVQKRLIALGYSIHGGADGTFGSYTKSAVVKFQKANGCVADGEITKARETWNKLLSLN